MVGWFLLSKSLWCELLTFFLQISLKLCNTKCDKSSFTVCRVMCLWTCELGGGGTVCVLTAFIDISST